MTETTDVWTRWEFEDRESAQAAVEILRKELGAVPGVAEVEAGLEPPDMGVMEFLEWVIVILTLPTALDNAKTSTANLVEAIKRLKSTLPGVRSAGIESEDGEMQNIDGS